MVVLNYTGGEVNAKIVYYGPGLSGKTTNLEFIHDRTPEGSRGKMVSMKTQTDRTLFFDFLPLELGEINGYRTRFLLYTVPGQVYYNATRKLVLKGVDAVVFVGDSSRAKLDENLESLRNLEQNLNEHGMSLDEIPWVIQYNKRDAADSMAVADLDARLNPLRVPSYEAVATVGQGVYETFHGIATLVYRVLKERLERGDLATEPTVTPSPGFTLPATAPAAPARPVAPVRREVTLASGENEFELDTAIDSMLREMDSPAARPAPRVAQMAPPPVAGPAVQGKVNTAAPAPAPPVREAGTPMVASPAPLNTPISTAAAAARADGAARERTALEAHPESFDLELGRLPALDDASFASDHARTQGPNEFVTDPMRRGLAAEAPMVKPAVADLRLDSPAPAPAEVRLADSTPAHKPAPAPVAKIEAEESVVVPVVLTREQIRSGGPIRLLLDIRVKDE